MTLDAILRDILLPVATLFIGWFTNAYRNRQQREKSVLDNVQQLLDMKSREVERAQKEVDRANEINNRQEEMCRKFEEKLERRERAIRKASKCDWVKTGHDCPITEADEKMRQECANCEENAVKK